MLSELTYIAAHHDDRIRRIGTVRAYHSGAKVIVEVDVILPSGMPLQEARDIGDSLHARLSRAACVERAYVLLDYEPRTSLRYSCGSSIDDTPQASALPSTRGAGHTREGGQQVTGAKAAPPGAGLAGQSWSQSPVQLSGPGCANDDSNDERTALVPS